ncbi:MAG: hypothetical protein WEE89_22170 [Gemmatimonadota bacterium]
MSALRRAAHQQRSFITTVDHGLDLGYIDRQDTTAVEVEARIIEGNSSALQAIPVRASEASGFTHFLDGIQRAEVRLYHGPIPIVYAYAAAVVRKRVDRRLVHSGDLLEEREALFFPFRLLDPDELGAAGITREHMVDSSPAAGEPLPLFPPTLYAHAAQAVNRWREGIERNVSRRWLDGAKPEDWLLADGTLTNSPELASSLRAVGLIKSHRTRFFDGDNARLLLGLGAGERTSVFEPQTRRWTPVHSWYLRLRDPHGHDVFWGLVRVEITASAHSAESADRISSWLLAELAPLALPAAQWDRLLYPIHDCQQFLRARAPSLHG